MPIKLTPDLIAAAIRGYELKLAELRAMLPGTGIETAAAPEAAPRKHKKFSAATRQKMALAQKARWAKASGESEPPQPAAASKSAQPKRRISKEGMARIIAATKKRWAAVRAAKAQQEKAAAKKTVAKKAAKTSPIKRARRITPAGTAVVVQPAAQ